MNTKPWYKSKTIYFGGALSALGLAALGLAILDLPEFQKIVETLPDGYQGIALLVVGIISLVLRSITTHGIRNEEHLRSFEEMRKEFPVAPDKPPERNLRQDE